MELIDRQYLVTPFYGSRKMVAWLKGQGHRVSRKRVRRLMRTMGLKAIYRRPRTSRPAPGHRVYPYLLCGMKVARPNQVWAADITYIPMARGVPLPGGHHRLVQPLPTLLEAFQTPWKAGPALRPWRRLSGRASRRASTLTRAHGSPDPAPPPGSRVPGPGRGHCGKQRWQHDRTLTRPIEDSRAQS